ncbi:hypothetical protein [Actinoplanes sp. NPDC051494]|uniref:hypothetical protein n=1 Tax=Actinoplanes sp. NPDC051494 TaxID=3363907 RepID=UPI0037B8AEC9
MRRHWDADRQTTAGMQFQGAADLLRLVAALTRRPWRYGDERLLPIVRLVRSPAVRTGPLDGAEDWLRGGRGIPYARTGTRRGAATVEDVLDVAVTDLAGDGARGRRLRFPHYGLALWLSHLEPLPQGVGDREEAELAGRLRTHLRQRVGGNEFGQDLADAVGDFPWWIRVPARFAPRLGLALLRASWRPPRWFAKQKMARGRGFYSLARDLARPDFADTHRDELDLLLTEAFVEDLRRSYRRTGLLGAGRRRTRYPVLLLDAREPPGERLLNLLATIRADAVESRSGGRPRIRRDPLLVLTDAAVPAGTVPAAPADAPMAYRTWRRKNWVFATDRSPFLDFQLPAELGGPGAWNDLGQVGLPARRTPWMSLVLPLLLIATMLTLPIRNHDRCEPLWWPGTGQTLQRESLGDKGSQCVGLAGDRFRFFGDEVSGEPGTAAGLRAVAATIEDTNAEVMADPDVVTVVYLGAFTGDNGSSYASVLAELRGLALQQLEARGDNVPIRILLANAGGLMAHGGRAAELIAAAKDRLGIVAVTGLGVSKEGVRAAIRTLDGAGIPTLGTLLSSDDLTRTALSYHQVGPANLREAAVAAYYARSRKKATAADIYYSGDPDDLYSGNLAQNVRTQFEHVGIEVRGYRAYRTPGAPGGDPLSVLARQACSARRGHLIFFAGRPGEFRQFLRDLTVSCPGDYPELLAGDAIASAVSSGQLGTIANLPLDYLTQASSLAWPFACADLSREVVFFTAYQAAGYGDICGNDGASRAMFGWDSLVTIREAIARGQRYGTTRVTRGTVAQGLAMITGSSPLEGATGTISFGPGSPVPVDKAMLVMGLDRAGKPVFRMLCGQISRARRPDPGCPSDTDLR